MKGVAASAPLVGPSTGEGVIHLLLWRPCNVLLAAELQIFLMLCFSADVGHAGFLVFKNVEDFALCGALLDFVARKLGVELRLLRGLRSTRIEAGCREQRCCLGRFRASAAGNENDGAGGRDENQA